MAFQFDHIGKMGFPLKICDFKIPSHISTLPPNLPFKYLPPRSHHLHFEESSNYYININHMTMGFIVLFVTPKLII